MLIDRFMPEWDAHEEHSIRIAAPPAAVWRAVLTLDLRKLWLAQALLAVRALPSLLLRRRRALAPTGPLTLFDLEDSGFGKLAELPEDEVLLGVSGRFWHPTGNVEPFERSEFEAPVRAGLARAVLELLGEARRLGHTTLHRDTHPRGRPAESAEVPALLVHCPARKWADSPPPAESDPPSLRRSDGRCGKGQLGASATQDRSARPSRGRPLLSGGSSNVRPADPVGRSNCPVRSRA